MAALELDTQLDGSVAVVAARGELDLATAPLLADELGRAAELPGAAAVVLDLREIAFMDSSGLRAVVAADRTLRGSGLRFALVRAGEPVHRVFDITRMTERLSWVGSPADVMPGSEESA
jgi:anti-anti-sigma factor